MIESRSMRNCVISDAAALKISAIWAAVGTNGNLKRNLSLLMIDPLLYNRANVKLHLFEKPE